MHICFVGRMKIAIVLVFGMKLLVLKTKYGQFLTSKTISFNKQNYKFLSIKPFVSKVYTLSFDYRKLSFQLVGCQQGYLHETAETDTFSYEKCLFRHKGAVFWSRFEE